MATIISTNGREFSMSKTISITASKRDVKGSANSRRLRAAGQVPAVVYSRGAENILLQASQDDVMKIAHHNGLVEIAVEGEATRLALVKEVQIHPLNNIPLCADFQEVKADEVVTVKVPVVILGDATGIEQVLRRVAISGAATAIPTKIVVEVAALQGRKVYTIGDLVLAEGLVAEGMPSQVIFNMRGR